MDKKRTGKLMNIEQLVKERYFRALLGSFCLYNNLCEPLELEIYIKRELDDKFPHDTKLLRSFIEYLDDDNQNQFLNPKQSRFDVMAAAKQVAAASSGKKK